ncbi:MAG: murein biosynthesis integral membrane protein MurJ [Chloroflexota bacterium]
MLNRDSQLLRASFLVIVLSLVNKITGYFKLVLVTASFGTGADADALAAATQIPDVFFVLVAGGAFGSAIIPVYSNLLLHSDYQRHARFVGTMLNLVVIVSGILSLIIAFNAPWVTRTILVPNFTPEQQLLTANLMRVSLLSIFVFGITSIFTNLLHAHKHFFLPAVGAVLLDIGYIIGLYFGAERLGVFAMVWGGFIGVILYAIVQAPALAKFRIGFMAAFDYDMAEVREVIMLLWPRLVVLGAIEIVDVVNVNLASRLSEGSVSSYFFALLLINMPVSLFGISFLTTFFPTLSDDYNLQDPASLHASVGKGVAYTFFWIIPSFVGLIALGRPGIAFLMERGAFTADSTAIVYSLVVVAALGAIAQAAGVLVDTLFFARHNTVTPMWFQILGMAITIFFSVLLVERYAIVGIAFARSLASVIILVSIIIFYQWRYGGLNLDRWLADLFKIIVASLVMSGSIRLLAAQMETGTLFVLVAICFGAVVYGIVHYMLGGRELIEFYNGIVGKKIPA